MRLALVAALVAALAGVAAAQPHDRLAVGSLDVSGDPGTPPERLARLRANLIGGFAAAGWIVLSDDEVKQKTAANPALMSCQSDVCFKSLGETVGAKWVLAGSLSVGASSAYSADVRLVEVSTGRTAARYSNSCGVCTTAEAKDWLGLVAADLKRQVEATMAPVPTPPVAGAVTAPPPPPPVSKSKVWAFRGAAIGAAALAVGGFILGGVEAGRSGPTCAAVPPADGCPERRDTVGGQAFGFTVGSVLLVGAAVLSYYGWFHWHGRTLALVPAVGPTGAAASLHLGF